MEQVEPQSGDNQEITADPRLVNALIQQESGGNPMAQSVPTPYGTAKGLGQLLDSTGQEEADAIGEEYNPFDADQNKRLTTNHLTKLLKAFDGDERLALAAYNAGERRIKNLQDEYGDSYDDIAAHLPVNKTDNTRKYVSNVMAKYEKTKVPEEVAPVEDSPQALNRSIVPDVTSVPPTASGFAGAAKELLANPDFQNLTFSQKAEAIDSLYGAKPWDKNTYSVVKGLMDYMWDGSPQEELPDLGDVVTKFGGPPPITDKGQDPVKTTASWANTLEQNMIRSGVSPASFGTKLDAYVKQLSDSEIEAYQDRNRGAFAQFGKDTGRFILDLASGATSAVAKPIAGYVRTGMNIGPMFPSFDTLDQETRDKIANTIEDLPSYLGPTSKDYLYQLDKNGHVIKNPDGTYQTRWMHNAGQMFGQVGAFIAGGELAAAYTGTAIAAEGLMFTANQLSMANDSFRSVYEQTGDTKKAYTAAAFSLPAAAIWGIGSMGIFGKALAPELQSLSLYDKARFFATSWAKNAAVAGVLGGSSDVIQQVGEMTQTGQPYSPERTKEAATSAAVAGGTVGAVSDVLRATPQVRSLVSQADTSLANFRDNFGTQRDTAIPAKLFNTKNADTLGITVTPKADGTAMLQKKTDIIAATDLPELLNQLHAQPTPNEIFKLGKVQAELASKPDRTPEEENQLKEINSTLSNLSRPEHVNNIKLIEGAIDHSLQNDPGQMMYRYDRTTNSWENVETGEKAPYLKDLITKTEAVKNPQYTKDLSDVSHVNYIDEDTLVKPVDKELPTKPEPTELPPLPEGPISEETRALKTKLDNINADILDLRNEKATAPDKATAKQIQGKIDNKIFDQRETRSQILRAKETVGEESQAEKDWKQQVRDIEAQDTEAIKNHNKEVTRIQAENKKATQEHKQKVSRINKVKQKGLGATITKGNKAEIVLPSGLEPQAKEQVLAHELGHAVLSKIELDKNADTAVNNKLDVLKDKSQVSTADDLAGTVFLPEVKKAVKIPQNTPVKNLESESKRALLSRSEFLANQLGAIILKRAGRNIGNYEILPEVEEALSKTKLPSLDREGQKVSQTPDINRVANQDQTTDLIEDTLKDYGITPGEPTARERAERRMDFLNEAIPKRQRVLDRDIAALEQAKAEADRYKNAEPGDNENYLKYRKALFDAEQIQRNIDYENKITQDLWAERSTLKKQLAQPDGFKASEQIPQKEHIDLNLKTGNQKETAFSKTVSKEIPEAPRTFYDEVSRIKGHQEGDAFVQKHGAEKTKEILTSNEVYSVTPESRIILTDALLRKAALDANTNPTAENVKKFNEALQIRAAAGTPAGQQLALFQRIRGTQTFADFIAETAKMYREAGQAPPEYTDYQLKELKALFDKTYALPEGVLKDGYVQKLWEKSLEAKGVSVPEFLTNYMRVNLLSGLGTPIIVGVSGGWMGPILTALRHPLLGRGLVWKAMLNSETQAVARSAAKRVLEGKSAFNIFGGMVDTRPVVYGDAKTVPQAMMKFYNKFGNQVFRNLGAIHSYLRALSNEGYLAAETYKNLKTKYGNDPAKFTTEVSKILLSRERMQGALAQAENEGRAAGINLSASDKYSRAYEILRKADIPNDILEAAQDWTIITSHMGQPANVINRLAYEMFTSNKWNLPYLKEAKLIIEPFGRAMIALSDFAADFVPGNALFDRVLRAGARKMNPDSVISQPKSEAALARQKVGQVVGTTLAAMLLGLSRTGGITITGDEEKQLGESEGKPAVGKSDFKEYEQKGVQPYSIIFPSGYSLNYKDLPGINAIAYGIYHMNKVLDKGDGSYGNMLAATMGFYRGAFLNYAMPFSGETSLNSPLIKFMSTITNPEADPKRFDSAFKDLAVGLAKMATPGSSLLRDIKTAYDSTPDETNQDLLIKMFKDVPGAAELMGSRAALDAFGEPIQKDLLEHIPGVKRIIGEVKTPSDPVWKALVEKGITVPEVGNTVKFTKASFGGSELYQQQYEKTREDRLGSAYTNSLTPDEWYEFRKATGPYVKSISAAIAASDLPQDVAQKELVKRVHAIWDQSKKRYIATGHF